MCIHATNNCAWASQLCDIICRIPTGINSVSSPNIVLTSTLNGRSIAYPQEVVVFTCVTRGASVLAWSSDEFIGEDIQLQFTSLDRQGSIIHGETAFASLVSVTIENEIVLKSTLQITASSQFPTSSVACRHIDGARINSITFSIAGEQSN